LPKVCVVLTRQMVLQEPHHRIGSGTPQVLEDVDVLPPRAHHTEAFREHGPILGGELVPVTLARAGEEAAHFGVMA
jgi:hypothetical protein